VNSKETIVVIPTLNEAQNLEILLPKLLELDVDVLIVDDASSDGTREVAESFNEGGTRVKVLSRPSKLGLGSAYREGFAIALDSGYQKIVQMDADGSHRVEDLAKMIEVARMDQATELVIGSRWVKGGSVVNWAKHREILSRVANRYSKLALATSIKDMTSGFRIYDVGLLRKMDLANIKSEGYSFQIEMSREAVSKGARITEVPITFVERIIGKSKMSPKIVREALARVTMWGFQRERNFNIGVLGLLLFTTFTTLWGLANSQRSEYYASIAMSMSKSFSNFIFGAIDPAGTVTLDKIPGSYWIPAIFVKIFGFSTWAIEAPNAIATICLVLVMAYAVKKYMGPVAGLIAGAIVATTPIVAAVARSNQPQSFFLFTLGLVALSVGKAIEKTSRKHLIIAGGFVALAFHTYMLEAWAVWPAIIVAWLFTQQKFGKKILDLLIAGSISFALSMVWIMTVFLIPASHRPYIGGTYHNNPIEMVFGYNGLGRFSATTSALSSTTDNPNFRSFTPPFGGSAGFGRLFNSQVAGQISWLIPTAVISALTLLILKKKLPITVFYTIWLITFFAMFSLVAGIHQFYTSALALPVAALIGAAIYTTYRDGKKIMLAIILISSVLAAIALSHKYGNYFAWASKVQVAALVLAIVLLVFRSSVLTKYVLPLVILISVILTPASWAVDVRNHSNSINPVAGDGSAAMGGGPRGGSANSVPSGKNPRDNSHGFNPGFGIRPPSGNFGPGSNGKNFPSGLGGPLGIQPPAGATQQQPPLMPPQGGRTLSGGLQNGKGFGGSFGQRDNSSLIKYLKGHRDGAKYLLVTFGAQSAASFITATGDYVMPVGGFDGQDPTPTLKRFKELVATGEIKYVLGGENRMGGGPNAGALGQSTKATSASVILEWVQSNCSKDLNAPSGTTLYSCKS